MTRNPTAQWVKHQAIYLPDYASPPEATGVVADGDSLTASGNTWANIFFRYAMSNIAVAGSTIVGANSITGRQATFDAGRASRTIGVIWCATNSLQNGVSGADCLTQLGTYIAARRASGWTVANGNPLVGANCMQRQSAGFPDGERVIYNAGFGGLDFDYHIDISQGPPGAPGDNILWDADKIHLLVLGQQWIYDNIYFFTLKGIPFS